MVQRKKKKARKKYKRNPKTSYMTMVGRKDILKKIFHRMKKKLK